MSDINITNSELSFQGDMVSGDKHVHLPPAPPREFRAHYQMPSDLQTFVGRAEHLKTLAGLGAIGVTPPPLHMGSGHGFLIMGIGGLGKTTLAIHIAHQLKIVFDGGVLWAEVPTTEPFNKLDEWARLYGGDLREVQEINARADALRHVLQTHAHNKKILAILDGVMDESDDAKLEPLLRALSDCAVVVTSRVTQLASFHNAHVIDLEHLNDDETIDLFERVTQHDKRLHNKNDVIIEIGKVVDFLPLALDLAAAQLRDNKSWTLEYLLTLLRDERRRLDTLQWGDGSTRGIRASILVSYKRLSPDEQKFFDALGAFAGDDFDVSAAAYVTETIEETARKLLMKLRRLSLVQEGRAPERYKLHLLIRDFAREQLRYAIRNDSTSLLASSYYCFIALQSTRQLDGKNYAMGFDILDLEFSNMESGLNYAIANGSNEGWECARRYIEWLLSQHFLGRKLFQTQARLMHSLVNGATKRNDYPVLYALIPMLAYLHTQIERFNSSKSKATLHLFAAENFKNDAFDLNFSRFIASVRESDAQFGQAVARQFCVMIASNYAASKNFRLAENYLEMAASSAIEINASLELAYIRNQQGQMKLEQGALDEARASHLLALETFQPINHRSGMIETLQYLIEICELTHDSTNQAKWQQQLVVLQKEGSTKE